MAKYFRLLIVILFLTSCEKEEIIPIQDVTDVVDTSSLTSKEESKIDIELDGRLPIDTNGYYHLKLVENTNQTIHRVSGKVYGNTRAVKIDWNSNLYWWLLQGQVVANITKTYINYFTGELTYVNLPPLTNWRDVLVPTINPTCYSDKDNEINTVIAPIYKMKGDTLIVTARLTETEIRKQIKIVLE